MEKTEFKTKLKRIAKAGFFNFWRSGYISFASVLVMVITLSVIGSVIFVGAILNITMQELRNKVDINVYLVTMAPESDILSLKTKIEALPEVSSVAYVSKDEALANFRLRHENDQVTIQALEELGDNPLGAVLNIKAKEPSQYEGIANFLNEENILSGDGQKIIDKINYFENRTSIDKLSRIIASAKSLGLVISLALILVSIIITLNTIRLTIYISREEISVMQLVGASKNYIKGPFVVTGILVGLISGLITTILFLPITYWLGNTTANFFVGLNIFNYYMSNFFQIVLIIVGSGIAIGAVSSYLAVRKYLKL
ncbi:MAG: permease-like cell division protein FtsX [Candidatus Paceibacterota bacterium]|jgi:cell division transport system permease protein